MNKEAWTDRSRLWRNGLDRIALAADVVLARRDSGIENNE